MEAVSWADSHDSVCISMQLSVFTIIFTLAQWLLRPRLFGTERLACPSRDTCIPQR